MTAIRKIKNESLKRIKNKSAKIIQLNIFEQQEKIITDKLINALWSFIKGALWLNVEFSTAEEKYFKQLLAEHFEANQNPKQTFKNLIERVCLAKRYVQRKPGRYISKPQDWLNIHYPHGLIRTAQWLNEVNKVRQNVPEYNLGITTLANGILKFIYSPNKTTVKKYKALLIEQNQTELLQLFYNTIIHIHYSI